MLARELAEPYPVVDLDSDAFAAARLLAERRLPGLIVNGDDGRPWTILPGSQVLRFVVPGYVQDDPAPRAGLRRTACRPAVSTAGERSVRELLPREPPELATLNAHDTAIEVAALMARLRTPLVAVLDRGELIGAITVSRPLSMLLPEASDGGSPMAAP